MYGNNNLRGYSIIRTFEESSPMEKTDEEWWLCGKQVNSQIQDLNGWKNCNVALDDFVLVHRILLDFHSLPQAGVL